MLKKNIALAAPFTSYSGYGLYGRSIAMMLILAYATDENINIFMFDLTGTALATVLKFLLNNSKYAGIEEYIKPLLDMEKLFFDLFMTVSVPQAFMQKGLINLGITALAEVDKVHPQLILHCNRMDEIIVMSQFNIESLNRSMFKLEDNREIKINVPAMALPTAFIEINSTATSDITEYINAIPQKFLFLAVGLWLPGNIGADRKDIGALISAFLRGFPNNKDIGLLLKVDQGRSTILSEYVMRLRINEICKGIGVLMSVNNIYFISGNLSESQMKLVYSNNRVKALVSFTHGLSLGIPIMEFIGLTGKPTLIPYHSGMLEYIKPEYSEILIHKLTQVPQELFQSFYRDFMIPESRWYTVDYQYALFKMADLISNYDSILVRSKKQQLHIKDNFNIKIMANNLKKMLDKHIILKEDF